MSRYRQYETGLYADRDLRPGWATSGRDQYRERRDDRYIEDRYRDERHWDDRRQYDDRDDRRRDDYYRDDDHDDDDDEQEDENEEENDIELQNLYHEINQLEQIVATQQQAAAAAAAAATTVPQAPPPQLPPDVEYVSPEIAGDNTAQVVVLKNLPDPYECEEEPPKAKEPVLDSVVIPDDVDLTYDSAGKAVVTNRKPNCAPANIVNVPHTKEGERVPEGDVNAFIPLGGCHTFKIDGLPQQQSCCVVQRPPSQPKAYKVQKVIVKKHKPKTLFEQIFMK